MWEEAYLCSIMRAHQAVPSLPGLKVVPSHPMNNDQALVTLASKYFWEGKQARVNLRESNRFVQDKSKCHVSS
jgi:hypothetical protein